LTVHIINPADYDFLDKPRPRLEQAGFGVMRGCITWKRSGEPSWEEVGRLLAELRTSALGY
jgi:hypothetical protein